VDIPGRHMHVVHPLTTQLMPIILWLMFFYL